MLQQSAAQSKISERMINRICEGEQKLVGRSDVPILVLNGVHSAFGIAFEVNDGRISAVVPR